MIYAPWSWYALPSPDGVHAQPPGIRGNAAEMMKHIDAISAARQQFCRCCGTTAELNKISLQSKQRASFRQSGCVLIRQRLPSISEPVSSPAAARICLRLLRLIACPTSPAVDQCFPLASSSKRYRNKFQLPRNPISTDKRMAVRCPLIFQEDGRVAFNDGFWPKGVPGVLPLRCGLTNVFVQALEPGVMFRDNLGQRRLILTRAPLFPV